MRYNCARWSRWLRQVAPLALAATLLSGGADARELEKVIYLLPAPIFLPAFGPWILARERGYYAAEGLDVEFETAKGGADVAKQVGIGNAAVGGALGDTPIIVRANGVPVRSVALMGGGSQTQLIFRTDSDIKSAADLKGKTVNVSTYQETTYYALLGMLAKVGLSKNDVNIVAAGAVNIWRLFVDGKADAVAGVPDYVAAIEMAGVKVTVIPSDRYFASMAQAIVASDTTIKEKPELVHKLVRATLHGLSDIMADPEGAARDYVKGSPENKDRLEYATRIFKFSQANVYPGQKVLGEMDPKRLAALQDFYVAQGIVAKATPVDELYTNQFIR